MSLSPPPSYDAHSNPYVSTTSLKPYLELPHLLSLTWLAYPILSLLFIAFRFQLSLTSAQDDVANAKADLLASCQAAQEAATAAASMPRYMAIATNDQSVTAVNDSMNTARATLVLALTVMEAIINFIVDIYRSTLLCFVELIVCGALSVVIGAVSADSLNQLNSSLPTFSQLKDDINAILDTPFELLKKDINDTFAGLLFNSSLLTVPEQNDVSFCDQLDTSVVDDLGQDLIKITKIRVIIIVILALLLVGLNCLLEWYKWRCQQAHLQYTREACTRTLAQDPDGAKEGEPHSRWSTSPKVIKIAPWMGMLSPTRRSHEHGAPPNRTMRQDSRSIPADVNLVYESSAVHVDHSPLAPPLHHGIPRSNIQAPSTLAPPQNRHRRSSSVPPWKMPPPVASSVTPVTRFLTSNSAQRPSNVPFATPFDDEHQAIVERAPPRQSYQTNPFTVVAM
ncbi:hypothetical protein GG344DRAFT_66800 [Lentinula edodes]|nr:hypothetical protein GG344DRAFT_66800 [Lentinula edodes]